MSVGWGRKDSGPKEYERDLRCPQRVRTLWVPRGGVPFGETRRHDERTSVEPNRVLESEELEYDHRTLRDNKLRSSEVDYPIPGDYIYFCEGLKLVTYYQIKSILVFMFDLCGEWTNWEVVSFNSCRQKMELTPKYVSPPFYVYSEICVSERTTDKPLSATESVEWTWSSKRRDVVPNSTRAELKVYSFWSESSHVVDNIVLI